MSHFPSADCHCFLKHDTRTKERSGIRAPTAIWVGCPWMACGIVCPPTAVFTFTALTLILKGHLWLWRNNLNLKNTDQSMKLFCQSPHSVTLAWPLDPPLFPTASQVFPTPGCVGQDVSKPQVSEVSWRLTPSSELLPSVIVPGLGFGPVYK